MQGINKLMFITIVAMILSISIDARTTAQVTADSIHAEQCEQGLLDISQCKSETEIRTGEKAFNDFTHGDRIDIGDFETQILDCTKPITNINLVGDYIWSYKHERDRLIKFSINEEGMYNEPVTFEINNKYSHHDELAAFALHVHNMTYNRTMISSIALANKYRKQVCKEVKKAYNRRKVMTKNNL
jgi:hypothetical protein